MEIAAASVQTREFVTFSLDRQKYAVDILKVQEINNIREITPIPNAPPYLEGAMNLRGKVIPVLSLRKKFGMPDRAIDDASKIVIMNIRGVMMGVIVDAVSDVLRVAADKIEPPPPVSTNLRAACIRGVAKLAGGLVILLDMDRLMDDQEHDAVFGAAMAA